MIHDTLKATNEIIEKRYLKGKEDRNNEIIDIIKQLKYTEYISIANSGDPVLDLKYQIEGDILDRLLEKIEKKKEK